MTEEKKIPGRDPAEDKTKKDYMKAATSATFARMAESGIDPIQAVNDMDLMQKTQTAQIITAMFMQNRQSLENIIQNSQAISGPALDAIRALLENAPQLSERIEQLNDTLTVMRTATPDKIDKIRQASELLRNNFEPIVKSLNTVLAASAQYAKTLVTIRERFNAGDLDAILDYIGVFPEMLPYIKKDLEARNAGREKPITWDELTATREDDSTLLEEILIAAEAAAERKKNRKPRGKREPALFEGDSDFIRMSSSRLPTILYQMLNINGQTQTLANNLNKTAKKNVAKVGKTQDGYNALVVTEQKAETTIEMLGEGALKTRPAKKLFVFILNEIYKTLFYDGKLKGYVLDFALEDMVTAGLYKTVSNARRAFWDGTRSIQAMRASGTLKEGKQTIKTGRRAVLFPTVDIKNNRGIVYLNDKITWEPILKYYTAMPSSCFRLSDNAFDLEYYIFNRARQQTKQIAEKGYFTANILSVAEFMNLPINEKKNPRQLVIRPLEKAIIEVNESLDSSRFFIEICTDKNGNLQRYLSGYLKVNLLNNYADTFIQIAHNKQKKINAAIAKSERVKETAAVKAEMKRLKEKQDS